jgi:hypothetical protein
LSGVTYNNDKLYIKYAPVVLKKILEVGSTLGESWWKKYIPSVFTKIKLEIEKNKYVRTLCILLTVANCMAYPFMNVVHNNNGSTYTIPSLLGILYSGTALYFFNDLPLAHYGFFNSIMMCVNYGMSKKIRFY